jgi:hypothetical protein
MAGISRFPALNAFGSFIDAPDPIYGTGSDGTVTISANTTLTTDKFYYNLTVNSDVVLNTAGYRVFVKNLLTLNSNSTIGVGTANNYTMTTGFSGTGTISGGGATNTAVTNSLGGNSASQTATPPTVAQGGTGVKPDLANSATLTGYWYQPTQSVRGYVLNASNTTPLFLRGGAGGSSGAGGGVLIIASRYISATATSYFDAAGLAGSGGGGGGVIIVISSGATLPSGLTTDVTGGTGCANGTVIYSQLV